jgi:hypothetical protein
MSLGISREERVARFVEPESRDAMADCLERVADEHSGCFTDEDAFVLECAIAAFREPSPDVWEPRKVAEHLACWITHTLSCVSQRDLRDDSLCRCGLSDALAALPTPLNTKGGGE